MIDPRDAALQSVMPAVMVPRFTPFEPLEAIGQRLLIAANGTWLEVRLAWIYIRVLVAPPAAVTVPYGQVEGEMSFIFGKLPRAMVTQFIEVARERCPNECAAWAVWNQTTDTVRLLMLDDEISVGHGHVKVNLPELEEDEHMILDLHSHGETGAFFSRTDNKDDQGGCKIAGVVGNLNQECVTTAFRLCANGLFVTLPFDAYPKG